LRVDGRRGDAAAERRLDEVAAAAELRRDALHALAGYDPDTAREQAVATGRRWFCGIPRRVRAAGSPSPTSRSSGATC
jgi:hypothetical protein